VELAFRAPRRFAFKERSRCAARSWRACAPAPLSPRARSEIIACHPHTTVVIWDYVALPPSLKLWRDEHAPVL